jgi:hypothetical protein
MYLLITMHLMIFTRGLASKISSQTKCVCDKINDETGIKIRYLNLFYYKLMLISQYTHNSYLMVCWFPLWRKSGLF